MHTQRLHYLLIDPGDRKRDSPARRVASSQSSSNDDDLPCGPTTGGNWNFPPRLGVMDPKLIGRETRPKPKRPLTQQDGLHQAREAFCLHRQWLSAPPSNSTLAGGGVTAQTAMVSTSTIRHKTFAGCSPLWPRQRRLEEWRRRTQLLAKYCKRIV